MAKKAGGKATTLLVFGVILVVLIVLCVLTTANANRYANEDKTTVSAQVSKVEYYNDYDSTNETYDEGYNIYITYTYAGNDFDDCLYTKTSKADEYSEGQLIHIEVFTETGEMASDTSGMSIFLIVGTVLYAVVGGFVILRKLR